MLKPGVYEKDKINLTTIMKELLEAKQPEDVGAVLTFQGITRRSGENDQVVKMIEMESYEEPANKMIQKICEEVEKKYSANLVLIYHLIGKFKVGEPLVLVVVTGKTRSKSIPALEEAIHRYKTEPALWKKEIYSDGSNQWISHA